METKARQPSRRSQTAHASAYVEAGATTRPMRALLLHLNQPEPSPYGRERIAQRKRPAIPC